MEVGRSSFPEDGGRSTGSRKHSLELSQISPVAQEFEMGCVPAVLGPGQCLKMHLDFVFVDFCEWKVLDPNDVNILISVRPSLQYIANGSRDLPH